MVSGRIESSSKHELVSEFISRQIADVPITAHAAADNLSSHD
jgi:hypothetical protein